MKNELNFTPFYLSFLRLCKEKGKTPTAVAKEAGLSKGSPTAWKNGAVPKKAQKEKLCLYFEVSEEVLLGYKENPAGEVPSGPAMYNQLSDEDKKLIDQMIERLYKKRFGDQ